MNERIKELALHSKLRPALLLHHWGKIDALTDSEQEELEQLEKFAELIVQECIDICMKEFDTGLLMAPQAPWIAKQIKEHFGVEE